MCILLLNTFLDFSCYVNKIFGEYIFVWSYLLTDILSPLSLCVCKSSKCRSVFSSAQKLDGYRRLDRQLAHFNDYNFVFTSYAKKPQQSQQS